MALHRRFRTHRMAVHRSGRTSDGQGGWIEASGPVAEMVGSLQPGSGAEGAAADQERALARWVVYCEETDDVARGDELTLLALIDRSGIETPVEDDRRWRVIVAGDWHAGGRADHRRVDLEEIQRGR